MIVLVTFSFIAGVITVLSPCILPILPILLSGSVQGGKKRPLGITTGFILSFTFFTLTIATIVKATGLPPDVLRIVAVIMVGAFGISMLIPKVQIILERLFSRLSGLTPSKKEVSGFAGGIFIGVSLGLVWAPCIGPIMASVISIAATGQVTASTILITIAYTAGTSIPMLAIIYGGEKIFQTIPWLKKNSNRIQKVFAGLMIILAVGIFFNVDRRFQLYILDVFPRYGSGITKVEDNQNIERELKQLRGTHVR